VKFPGSTHPYIKLRGRWVYLYRAVDRAGQTVDFRLSAKRDVAAAKAFFKKAIKHQGRAPHTVSLDGYAASHRAVREMKADGLLPEGTKVRSSKYLNNLIEQDHRNVKSRVNVMLGFKRFKNAAITLAGIELMHRIRKGQFNLPNLGLKDTAAPAVWNAVLSSRYGGQPSARFSSVPPICTRADPFAAQFDIRLIDTPGLTGGRAKTVPAFDELRCIALHPTQDRGVRQRQSSLGHHFHQVSQTELVAQVRANTQDDHLAIKVPPREQILQTLKLTHRRLSIRSARTVTASTRYLHQSP
jgi:hypothetical protein